MISRWWNDDDQLLAALAEALREVRDVPHPFVETGKAAFAWHNIDAELARLTYDSAAEALGPATATRAERAVLREVTLASSQLKIHLQITDEAVRGQVVPAQPCQLELRAAAQPPIGITTDNDGWFTLRPIPVGSFRLHCRTASSVTALTDCLTI
jgi:hypothetical protein